MRPHPQRHFLVAGVRFAFLAVFTGLCAACGGSEVSEDRDGGLLGRARSDVILVTIDTLRHDATGFSGAGRVETPALDRLAAAGRIWPFAHAHSVVTLPSHATILSGLLPYEHGIRDNAGFVFPQNLPTLATRLSAEGYATGAFVSAFPLDRRFGLARGFDTYDDDYQGHGGDAFGIAERPGEITVARALEWWDEQTAKPRFMWVHLFTPHFPYEPGEPLLSRYAAAPYFGDVARADAQLATLLDATRATGAGAPITLVTADHGESLGDHGEETHGVFAYESTLRVPFVLSAPGLVEPGTDQRPARLVDVMPTLLDVLGLSVPDDVSGRSLFEAGSDPGSYFEALSANLNRGWAPLYGRIENGKKAIDLPIRELYDLGDDPGETHSRADRGRERWSKIVAEIPAAARAAVERGAVDSDVAERLRGLGYVASTAPPREQKRYGPDDDPKNRIQDQSRMFAALSVYRAGRTEQAIAELRKLVSEQPGFATAYGHLGFMLADQGRLNEAAVELEQAIRGGADNESIRRRLALVLMRSGRGVDAWEFLQKHVDSVDPETQLVLGRVAATLGNDSEAAARIERALVLDPTFPEALVDRGILLMMQDRFAAAEPELRAGLAAGPDHAEGWNALGVIRSRAGDLTGAEAAWTRAVEVDPRLPDALFNLALLLGRTGRHVGAADALERYIELVEGNDRRRAEEMLRQLRAAEG